MHNTVCSSCLQRNWRCSKERPSDGQRVLFKTKADLIDFYCEKTVAMFRFCGGEESGLKSKAARDSGGLTANGLEYPTDVFQTLIYEY